MRCLGHNKRGERCKRHCKFFYCRYHWVEGLGLLGTILGIPLAIYTYYQIGSSVNISNNLPSKKNEPVENFKTVFKRSDSLSFNVLILRFEDYVNEENNYCIGRAIQENIQTSLNNSELKLPVNVAYADSIEPPKSLNSIRRLQDFHNADLLIYGLAENISEDCGDANICFRYRIDGDIIDNISSEVGISSFKHDLEYERTSAKEIEYGLFKIDSLTLESWLKSLSKLKANEEGEAFLELANIGNNISSLTPIEQVEKYNQIGHIYNGLRQYQRAIKSHEKALSLIPSQNTYQNYQIESLRNLYSNYLRLNEYDKAIKITKRIISIRPWSEFYQNLAYLYSKIENYSKAIEASEICLQKRQRIGCVKSIAEIYVQRGDFGKAESYYNNYVKLDTLNISRFKDRGRFYVQNQRLNKGIADYHRFIGLSSEESKESYLEANIEIGQLLWIDKQYQYSLEFFSKVDYKDLDEAKSNMVKKYFFDLYLRLNRKEDAVSILNDFNFENEKYLNNRKRKVMKLIRHGKYEEAIAEVDMFPPFGFNSKIFNKLLWEFKEAEEYELLLFITDEGLSKYKEFWHYKYYKGWALKNLGKYQEALELFVEVNNNNIKGNIRYKKYYSIGHTYMKLNQYDKAIYYLEKQVMVNPSAITCNNLGLSYLYIKEYNKALKNFRLALNYDKTATYVYANIVFCFFFKYWIYITAVLGLWLLFKFAKREKIN